MTTLNCPLVEQRATLLQLIDSVKKSRRQHKLILTTTSKELLLKAKILNDQSEIQDDTNITYVKIYFHYINICLFTKYILNPLNVLLEVLNND
jgi:hypothetical protein